MVQLLPDLLFYEANHTSIHGPSIGLDSETIAALQRRGHTMFPLPYGGVAQLIVQDLEDPVGGGYVGEGEGRRVLRGGEGQEEGVRAEDGMGVGRRDGPGTGRKIGRLLGPGVYRGKLTAVSDPRKDGVPAGY